MVQANSINAGSAGFQSFDGTATFVGRTITAGSDISISNGSGVSGNPTITNPSPLNFVQVNILSADFKNINSVPVVLLASPGLGKAIIPLQGMLKLNYGGNNAFTSTNPCIIYYTTSGTTTGKVLNFVLTSFGGVIDKAYTFTEPSMLAGQVPCENQSLSITVTVANPAGNAAGDNTVTVGMFYQIVTMT